VLVACFVTFEAPLSGMSMNPARSLASAAPAGLWQHFWIYVLAPVLGMASAALLRPADWRGPDAVRRRLNGHPDGHAAAIATAGTP
jgi:hypothetical protein